MRGETKNQFEPGGQELEALGAHPIPWSIKERGINFSVLRLPDVCKKVALGRATLYALMNPKSRYFDASFPRAIRLSEHGKAVGWIASEIDEWLLSRIQATRSTT